MLTAQERTALACLMIPVSSVSLTVLTHGVVEALTPVCESALIVGECIYK